MSRDEENRLERMEKVLSRIETAVLGDEEAGHLGLVSRVNNHAGRLKRLERWRAWSAAVIVGGGALLGAIYKVATDWWPRSG